MFNIISFIRDRAHGKVHTKEDIDTFANLAAKGDIPDYQISAWLMAAYLTPLSHKETVDLTLGMANNGERLDLSSLPKPWVDKHSTGGVGDKTSLVLLPLLASCGLTMVKMSGRGLGITGGTLDKLESIPGFKTDLTPRQAINQARKIGIVLTGQSLKLAPADKIFYSLRDSTSTVDSMPLIVSSILSKKIAGGSEYIALDVKCGSGAFMKSQQEAYKLSNELKAVGKSCGLNIISQVSDMSQVLGESAGNALEVDEAFSILKNEPLSPNSSRFRDLCLFFASEILLFTSKCKSREEAEMLSMQMLQTGKAWSKAQEWIKAQGATACEPIQETLYTRVVAANESGYLHRIEAGNIGQAVVELGGGRQNKESSIDHAVGVKVHALVGDKLTEGQQLVTVFARSEAQAQRAVSLISDGISISQIPIPPKAVILNSD